MVGSKGSAANAGASFANLICPLSLFGSPLVSLKSPKWQEMRVAFRTIRIDAFIRLRKEETAAATSTAVAMSTLCAAPIAIAVCQRTRQSSASKCATWSRVLLFATSRMRRSTLASVLPLRYQLNLPCSIRICRPKAVHQGCLLRFLRHPCSQCVYTSLLVPYGLIKGPSSCARTLSRRSPQSCTTTTCALQGWKEGQPCSCRCRGRKGCCCPCWPFGSCCMIFCFHFLSYELSLRLAYNEACRILTLSQRESTILPSKQLRMFRSEAVPHVRVVMHVCRGW